jgi:hypothetical protein
VNVKNLKGEDKKWELMIYTKVKSVDGGIMIAEEHGTRVIPKDRHVRLNLV